MALKMSVFYLLLLRYSGAMEPPPSYTSDRIRRRSSGQGEEKVGPSVDETFQGNLTKMVWDAGSKQVRQAFGWYTNIDMFRPYFDVEPKMVRNRLLQSLIPRRPSAMQTPGSDLYGPLMLIFTLCALLLYVMKSSDITIKDGTLIGSSFVTCFGYWMFTSLAVYTLSYIFSSDVSLVEVFSLLGYALFGHCLVIALTAFFHPAHEHLFFYALITVFGGLSSLRMITYFAYKTPEKSHKLFISVVVCTLHLGFLLYLHFGFHEVVEELGTILGETDISALKTTLAVIIKANGSVA